MSIRESAAFRCVMLAFTYTRTIVAQISRFYGLLLSGRGEIDVECDTKNLLSFVLSIIWLQYPPVLPENAKRTVNVNENTNDVTAVCSVQPPGA